MWKSLTTPIWIGRIVGILGLVSFIDAAHPMDRFHIHEVRDFVPAMFPEAATTGALAASVMLILLSRALRRGKFRAWLITLVLVFVDAALHVIRAFHFIEAGVLLLLAALLIVSRKNFTAKPDPQSLGLLIKVIFFGPIVATALGFLYLEIYTRGQAHDTSWWDRVQQAFLGLVGVSGPIDFPSDRANDRAYVALAVLGASLLVTLLIAATIPKDGPHPLSSEEEQKVREILDKWGKVDSLSYFATRDDRSVIFSKTGKAAVSYRVVQGVTLAGGDPLGDPEAWPGAIEMWLAEAKTYGWVPAVLGASEQAAATYHRTGMGVLELGDEAILEVDKFSLEGRSMRVVRQAVARCKRAGLEVTCRRVGDLTDAEREEIRNKAHEWRDGHVERGFSMALGRFVDPKDARSVVVLCRDGDGVLRGLLNLVPWGQDGLSLDLMRRDRDTENGIMELMVVALWEACGELGVTRVSLNFAVFRSVFARGERLGAGPFLRLWRAILMAASRYWQIESLYRANAKYQPEWEPRFLVYRTPSDLPRIGTAALRAEAFLVAPEWFQKLTRR